MSARAEHLAREVTLATEVVLRVTLGATDGACLGTCALLACALAEQEVLTYAVRGTFDGQAHWWLELDGETGRVRCDPTRSQFDAGALITSIAEDASLYVAEESFVSGWTSAQAVEEFVRMFTFPPAAVGQARDLLAELSELAGLTAEHHTAPALSV